MPGRFGKTPVRFLASPNYDNRSASAVDTIVLHATAHPDLHLVLRKLTNPASKVSAHFVIDRDGVIYLLVPPALRAWHAGPSRMPDGREGVNDFSIGIELMNLNDGRMPYPDVQLSALMNLVGEISKTYPIRHIVPHARIAAPPGRKSDPRGLIEALCQQGIAKRFPISIDCHDEWVLPVNLGPSSAALTPE